MLLARGATDGTESTNTKRIEFSYVASNKKHASFIFLANGYTDDAPKNPPEPETHPRPQRSSGLLSFFEQQLHFKEIPIYVDLHLSIHQLHKRICNR